MDVLQMGFYCGMSILYPYAPVYCPTEDCMGDCRSVYIFWSESAPLPASQKYCEASDIRVPEPDRWFQWKPREMSLDRQKYIGARVCFWADRGPAKRLNDLERDK